MAREEKTTGNGDQDSESDDAELCQWDGSWTTEGLHGMFVDFSHEIFCEQEQIEFQNDQKQIGMSLQQHHEFLIMPPEPSEECWGKVRNEILIPRQLHVAGAVLRRFAAGICPKAIRIRKMKSDTMELFLSHKKAGNVAFQKKEYENALQSYHEALALVPSNFYVAPSEQIKEIVATLSNQAECYLRLKEYQAAGSVATDALMFDGAHEKSRMRRAKANIAISGAPHLLQAAVDLREIVENGFTKSASKEATDMLNQLDEVIEMEKRVFEKAQSSDWSLYVRLIESQCW